MTLCNPPGDLPEGIYCRFSSIHFLFANLYNAYSSHDPTSFARTLFQPYSHLRLSNIGRYFLPKGPGSIGSNLEIQFQRTDLCCSIKIFMKEETTYQAESNLRTLKDLQKAKGIT